MTFAGRLLAGLAAIRSMCSRNSVCGSHSGQRNVISPNEASHHRGDTSAAQSVYQGSSG